MARFNNLNLSNDMETKISRAKPKRSRLNIIQRRLVAWGVPVILFLLATAIALPRPRYRGAENYSGVFLLWAFIAIVALIINLYLWRDRKNRE